MPANTSKNNKSRNPIVTSVLCGIISSALYFVFISIFAVISLNTSISSSVYMPAGLIIGAVTGFAGGFITAKIIKEKGALYGLLSGVAQAFICALILFIINGGIAGKGIFIFSAIIIGVAIAGGVSGVNLKIKKKY